MLSVRLAAPPAARQLGQWAIGVALGLYFSPHVVREVVRLAPWLLLGIVFASCWEPSVHGCCGG